MRGRIMSKNTIFSLTHPGKNQGKNDTEDTNKKAKENGFETGIRFKKSIWTESWIYFFAEKTLVLLSIFLGRTNKPDESRRLILR